MNINKGELTQLAQDGLVTARRHSDWPLTIYNYTDRVQYDRLWTPLLLQCRGLVVDDDGEIVARPFAKFFNLEEHGTHELAPPIEWHRPWVAHEKMDGSLGIVFKYRGNTMVATRGSFDSEQAEWLREYFTGHGWPSVEQGTTLLGEIICPDSRVIVPYERFGFVPLAVVDNATGLDTPAGGEWTPRVYHALDVDDLLAKETDGSKFEGWVIRFDNGVRVKVKLAEYKRLHAILSHLSTTSVWEALASRTDPMLALSGVPDEATNDVRGYSKQLMEQHTGVMSRVEGVVSRASSLPDRKSKALAICNQLPVPERAVAFAMLDGKDAGAVAWKAIKPEFARLGQQKRSVR